MKTKVRRTRPTAPAPYPLVPLHVGDRWCDTDLAEVYRLRSPSEPVANKVAILTEHSRVRVCVTKEPYAASYRYVPYQLSATERTQIEEALPMLTWTGHTVPHVFRAAADSLRALNSALGDFADAIHARHVGTDTSVLRWSSIYLLAALVADSPTPFVAEVGCSERPMAEVVARLQAPRASNSQRKVGAFLRHVEANRGTAYLLEVECAAGTLDDAAAVKSCWINAGIVAGMAFPWRESRMAEVPRWKIQRSWPRWEHFLRAECRIR